MKNRDSLDEEIKIIKTKLINIRKDLYERIRYSKSYSSSIKEDGSDYRRIGAMLEILAI